VGMPKKSWCRYLKLFTMGCPAALLLRWVSAWNCTPDRPHLEVFSHPNHRPPSAQINANGCACTPVDV